LIPANRGKNSANARRIVAAGPGAMGSHRPDIGSHLSREQQEVEINGRWKTFVGFKGAPARDRYQRPLVSTENKQIIALQLRSGRGGHQRVTAARTGYWDNQQTWTSFYHVTPTIAFRIGLG